MALRPRCNVCRAQCFPWRRLNMTQHIWSDVRRSQHHVENVSDADHHLADTFWCGWMFNYPNRVGRQTQSETFPLSAAVVFVSLRVSDCDLVCDAFMVFTSNRTIRFQRWTSTWAITWCRRESWSFCRTISEPWSSSPTSCSTSYTQTGWENWAVMLKSPWSSKNRWKIPHYCHLISKNKVKVENT